MEGRISGDQGIREKRGRRVEIEVISNIEKGISNVEVNNPQDKLEGENNPGWRTPHQFTAVA